MVREVESRNDRHYRVSAKAVGGFFRGRHKGLSDDAPVGTKWIRLDDLRIGTWAEEGIDYLFTFQPPGKTDAG